MTSRMWGLFRAPKRMFYLAIGEQPARAERLYIKRLCIIKVHQITNGEKMCAVDFSTWIEILRPPGWRVGGRVKGAAENKTRNVPRQKNREKIPTSEHKDLNETLSHCECM